MAPNGSITGMLSLGVGLLLLPLYYRLYSEIDEFDPNKADEKNCKIQCDGIEIINHGIEKMYPQIEIEGRYYDALKEFYNKINDNETAFEIIKEYLMNEFSDTDYLISQGKQKFENGTNYANSSNALLIYLYTTKSRKISIYKRLNDILRNQSKDCTKKKLSTEEKNIAPYAAALTAILLHWESLRPINKTTYRGINTFISDRNVSVLWTSFTSSSLNESQAKSYGNLTFYTINNNYNKTRHAWQPKLISNFSAAPDEEEALYPPGSVFDNVVIFINTTHSSYNLNLIDQSDNGCNLNNQHDSNSVKKELR